MNRKFLAIPALAGGLALGAIGCSSNSGSAGSASPSAPKTSAAAATGAAASSPFGPGCSAVPKTGAGGFSGMSAAPVASAASANPILSTLVTAVKKAGLVGTLNSASNITVFAPDNAAFAKIPPATLKKVLADKAVLTKILTYHVAKGRTTPTQLAAGTPIKTLEGQTIMPTKMGSSYHVNGAGVVCGNVRTANATVYIINKVLMPSS
jgi:uncharacterized surface protein with fasciclin (FAS1) repeats